MTSYTVTAAQSVNTSPGGQLLVQVLTSAQMAGTPATGSSTTAYSCSVTTTQTGSMVFGALSNLADDLAMTALAGTTKTEFLDTTNITDYWAWRSTSATGTPGPTSFGSSTTFNQYYGCCGVEVVPNGTIAIDGSSPAVVTSVSATSLTTASFTPPAAGALLVAMVAVDGNGNGTTTMTVSSSPALTWTEQVKINTSVTAVFSYLGVWTAVVPASAAVGPALPAQYMVRRPALVVSNAGWRGAQHSR